MDNTSTTPDDDSTPTSLLSGMSLRHRVGLGIAATAVTIGLCWSVRSKTSTDLVPLVTDTPLTPAAARDLCTTFQDAGLSGFHRSGEQILVPRKQLDRYSAMLPAQAPARDWAAEWEHQNERLTPFSGVRAVETNREIARAKLITGMLRQLPDVGHADIVWDEDEQPGWRQSAKTRATVYLNPKPEHVLTLDVIRAVRLAVAGSKKNLSAEDVVVMDLARQVTYEGPLPHSAVDDVLPQLRSFAELYRREIRAHVSELNEAEIAVRVDLPRVFEQFSEQGGLGRQPGVSADHLSAIAPDLMHVHVTLPLGLDVPSTAEDDLRRSIQGRIMQVTGIGREKTQGQLTVRFHRAESAAPTSPRSELFAGLSLPSVRESPQGLAAGVLLVVAALTLLIRILIRRIQRSKSSSLTTAVPTFHDVQKSSRQFSGMDHTSRFVEVSGLAPEDIRRVYSQSPPRCWAVALRGAPPQTGDQIEAALVSPAAGELRQELERLGPVKLGDIQSAQQRILETLDMFHAPAE